MAEQQEQSQPGYLKQTKRAQNAQQDEGSDSENEGKQFVMLNSRMKDGHFDPSLHTLHWKSSGKTPDYKYTYSKDQGLGYKINSNFEQKIEEERQQLVERKKVQQKNFHDNKKSHKFRLYKELENLNEDEVVITIEYCTNCKTHNQTTRHDEQKYLNQALSLQKEILKCFPIITVYLKPNVYDERDKTIDTLYIRQRLGAFDVQIAAGQKSGPSMKGILHSKLKSGKWADHADILSQIRSYMKKTNLRITLTLQDFNLDDIDKSNHKNKKINKLFDIEVSLRPKREKVIYGGKGSSEKLAMVEFEEQSPRSQGRPTSAMSRKSVKSRPKSAVSNISHKSRNQSMMTAGGTVKEYDTSKDKIVAKSQPDGTVIFENIPYDVYHIEIEESNEFKQLREQVDIFEFLRNNEPLDIQFNLKHLNLTFLKLICTWGVHASAQDIKTLKTFAGQDSNGEYRLLSKGALDKANLEVIPIRDGEEIVDETYDDNFNGSCEVTLLPGREYQIKIFKKGYKTLDQRITLQPGFQEIEFCVEKKNQQDEDDELEAQPKQYQQQEQRQVYTKQQKPNDRPGSGRPGSAKMEQTQRPVSGAKILYIFTYDGTTKTSQPIEGASIVIKERKMKREEEVYKTDKNGVCQIKLNQVLEGSLEISHPDYISMTEEYGPNKFDLSKQGEINFPLMRKTSPGEMQIRVLTNCGQKILSLFAIAPNDEIIGESKNNIEIDNSFDNGNGFMSIKDLQTQKGIYRIYAALHEPDQLNPNYVKVFAIYNNKQYYIEVPKNTDLEQGKTQLLGFRILQMLLKMNSQKQMLPVQILSEKKPFYLNIKKFLNFIKSSKVELKQLLGFNSKQKLQIYEEVYQSSKQIFNSLEQYGMEASQALMHIIASGKGTNGLYCFSKLSNKFNSINSQQNWVIKEDDNQDYDEEAQQFEDY